MKWWRVIVRQTHVHLESIGERKWLAWTFFDLSLSFGFLLLRSLRFLLEKEEGNITQNSLHGKEFDLYCTLFLIMRLRRKAARRRRERETGEDIWVEAVGVIGSHKEMGKNAL